MSKFVLRCECGEEVELSGYHSNGNINNTLLSIEITIVEDDPTSAEVNFDCQNCGNKFYIST